MREALGEILAIYERRAGSEAALGAVLCDTAVEAIEVSGAGLTLQQHDGIWLDWATSDERMAALHDLEHTLGEGPCLLAARTGRPTATPDLGWVGELRWPAFCVGAAAVGARAAFGFPLQAGGAAFGALNLYRDTTGPLTDDQHQRGIAVARVAAHVVLRSIDIESIAHPTATTEEVEQVDVTVANATGMVSVQLSCSISDALATLRARAFSTGRSVTDVAADVVARKQRFER